MDMTPKRTTAPDAEPKNSDSEYFAEGEVDELNEFDVALPEGPGEAEVFEPLEEADVEPGRLEIDEAVAAEAETEDEVESDEAETESEEREPSEDEFEEIEEEDLDVESGPGMAEMPDDSVRMYLKEIGRVQLLDSDREIWLATQMLAEDRVVQLRAQNAKNKGSLTHSEMLLTLFDDLVANWEHLIESLKRHKQAPLDLCPLIH